MNLLEREDAVATSLNTAGRTVAFAGGILVLAGLVVIGISFGWALVAGRNRVPSPPTGKTALRTLIGMIGSSEK